MFNGIYTKKVIDRFQNPKNYGKIEDADGVGEVGNIMCGDIMRFYFKLGKNKKGEEVIKKASFEAYGCAAAIATSSVACDLMKGKTITEALKVKKDGIVEFLGGLPPIKIHCSVLALDAFAEAVHNYLSKNKKEIPEGLEKVHQRIEKEKVAMDHKHGVEE